MGSDILVTENSTERRTAGLIVGRLKEAGYEAWLVGGCVRDLILGVAPGDYDIATSAGPDEIRRIFPRTIPIGESFGIMLVVEGGKGYEVARFRSEEGYEDGRHPSRVFPASAREDVERRDFTINGLLMDPESGEIVDYVEGKRDIGRRLLRAIGDPERRFAEDRLRMLRAIRFAAKLDFGIDTATLAAIAGSAGAIREISPERISGELSGILVCPGARRGLELLSETGLLVELLPEIAALRGVEQPPLFHPEGDVWEHTLRMLDLMGKGGKNVSSRLAWGVLLHDVGKASTRTKDEKGVHFYRHVERGVEIAGDILARLRFSREDQETIIALVREHMMFMNVKMMRPARLKRFLRMPEFELHLELHRLDCLGSHGMLDFYDFCQEKLREYPDDQLRPAPLITGRDLIQLGFVPGPLFREILLAVEDAQLSGEIVAAAAAREFVVGRWGDSLKLS